MPTLDWIQWLALAYALLAVVCAARMWPRR